MHKLKIIKVNFITAQIQDLNILATWMPIWNQTIPLGNFYLGHRDFCYTKMKCCTNFLCKIYEEQIFFPFWPSIKNVAVGIVPELGAIDVGFDIKAGTEAIGPGVVGEYMWAGRPIVWDWWKWYRGYMGITAFAPTSGWPGYTCEKCPFM